MSNPNFYEKPMPERGAGELQFFLQEKRTELQSLGADIETAHDTLENAEIRWIEVYDETVEQLEEDVTAGRLSKLPGEDLRLSEARRNNRDAWNTYRRAERVVKKLEKRATLIANQISAAQSEAKLGGVV